MTTQTRCPVCGSRDTQVDPGLGVAQCTACETVFQLEASAPAVRSGVSLPASGQTTALRWRNTHTDAWAFAAGAIAVFTAYSTLSALTLGHLPSVVGLVIPLGAAYISAAFLLNSTQVTVSSGEVSVVHEPLPWPGSGAFQRSSIAGLSVAEREVRTKSSRYTVYDLVGRHVSGHKMTLVKGHHDPGALRDLGEQIAEAYGVPMT